jgi:hypothetical protein
LSMENLIHAFKPDYIIYAGVIGLFLGCLFSLVFLYRRILWLIRMIARKTTASPGLFKSLRNLILIALWTCGFGMLLFMGFFIRTYYAFSYEKPIAEVVVEPLGSEKAGRITLVVFSPPKLKRFVVHGDQWVIEADIVKWDNWLYLLGLKNRYRLTRLRGRYIKTTEEISQKQTVFALVKDEEHPLWKYLYDYGAWFPLVNTVYGSAVFQSMGNTKQYQIYIGTTGLLTREKR